MPKDFPNAPMGVIGLEIPHLPWKLPQVFGQHVGFSGIVFDQQAAFIGIQGVLPF
jgi:hypothetical protein